MAWYDFLFQKGRDPLSQAIIDLLSSAGDAIVRFFDSLFQAEVEIADNIQHLHTNFESLRANIQTEIERVREFEFNPEWKSRVINVPKAIEQIKALIAEVTEGWRDRFELLRAPIHELTLIFKAEEIPDAGDPLHQVSGLSKATVKIDEIATMVKQLAAASDQIVEVVELFDKVFNAIEKLEPLFLQQGNTRQRLSAYEKETGKKLDPSLRIGSLHQAGTSDTSDGAA